MIPWAADGGARPRIAGLPECLLGEWRQGTAHLEGAQYGSHDLLRDDVLNK